MAFPAEASAYALLAQVGGGASSSVHEATVLAVPESRVALKRIDLERHRTLDHVRTEVSALRRLEHANIAALHVAFVARGELWLVVPFHSCGSCVDVIAWSRPGGFEEPTVMLIGREVIKGLAYLHEHGVIHRHLKGSNVLLDERGCVRLTDFGLAGDLLEGGERRDRARTYVGSPAWLAPEVLEQVTGYGTPADMWSLGITLIELSCGVAPHAGLPPLKVLVEVLQPKEPPSLPDSRSKALKQLVANCLQRAPQQRPTASTLLAKERALRQLDEGAARTQLLALIEALPPLQERYESEPGGGVDAARTHAGGAGGIERQGSALCATTEHLAASGEPWDFDLPSEAPAPAAASSTAAAPTAAPAPAAPAAASASAEEEDGSGMVLAAEMARRILDSALQRAAEVPAAQESVALTPAPMAAAAAVEQQHPPAAVAASVAAVLSLVTDGAAAAPARGVSGAGTSTVAVRLTLSLVPRVVGPSALVTAVALSASGRAPTPAFERRFSYESEFSEAAVEVSAVTAAREDARARAVSADLPPPPSPSHRSPPYTRAAPPPPPPTPTPPGAIYPHLNAAAVAAGAPVLPPLYGPPTVQGQPSSSLPSLSPASSVGSQPSSIGVAGVGGRTGGTARRSFVITEPSGQPDADGTESTKARDERIEAAMRGTHRLLAHADEELTSLRDASHAWVALPEACTPPPWPTSARPWMALEACVALRQQLREHNAMLRQHNQLLRHCLGVGYLPPAPPSPGSVASGSDRGSEADFQHVS